MKFLSIYRGYNSVNIVVEFSELTEISPHTILVGVENVRSVPMNHDSVLITIIETIARDMIPPVDDGNMPSAIH